LQFVLDFKHDGYSRVCVFVYRPGFPVVWQGLFLPVMLIFIIPSCLYIV